MRDWISEEFDCNYCERRHHTEVGCNVILLKEITTILGRLDDRLSKLV